MYHAKYDALVKFCNDLVIKVPWKLDDALEDVDGNNIPPSILRFIYLCEHMVKRFQVKLKDLKERKAKCIILLLLYIFHVLI